MDVRLIGQFVTRSPLSHIGSVESTTSFLVQEPVLQPDGRVEEVFAYSGNAWRGQLRDLAAAYLLRGLGDVRLPTDAFHLLFSGGRIGGEQSVNIEQARAQRRGIPLIALWGGGIGNQILPGKLAFVSNAYPVCIESPVAPEGAAPVVSYAVLTTEKSFSRKDDSKDDRLNRYLALPEPAQAMLTDPDAQPGKTEKAKREGPADQMRMTVELLIAGVTLTQHIDVLDCSHVELGCLVSALHEFAKSPHIGGQGGKGHGLVDLSYDVLDLDTGERRPLFAVTGGVRRLAPAGTEALAAYDAYLRMLYDAMLTEQGGAMRKLLGAVATEAA